MHTADTSFTVESCIHGYHVFQHIWVPIHGEVLSCSRECGNRSDPFAVALKIEEDIVGHVPRQFSCACSLFLQSDGLLVCGVSGDRRYSCDLLQGGMEIPCVYTFSGAPDLVHKTRQRLGELKAVIKEISSGILDSLKLSDPQSGHAAVTDLEMIENDTEPVVIDITNDDGTTDVTCKEVWIKTQDIILTLEDKHIVIDGLRLKDQHVNSVHRLLRQQFPSINELRLSLLQDETKGSTSNALQILHVMTNHWYWLLLKKVVKWFIYMTQYIHHWISQPQNQSRGYYDEALVTSR